MASGSQGLVQQLGSWLLHRKVSPCFPQKQVFPSGLLPVLERKLRAESDVFSASHSVGAAGLPLNNPLSLLSCS